MFSPKNNFQVMEYLLNIFCFFSLLYFILQLSKLILKRRNQSCYMLAYECFQPKEETKLNTDTCVRIVSRNKNLGLEQFRYLLNTMVSSGIGENTYCPKLVHEGRETCPTLKDTYEEIDEIMFDTLDNLFKKTCFSPSEIDILVVTDSLFSPIPSLTARIINRYKLREDVKVFNLAAMGCSANLVAVDLVQQLFKTHENSIGIIVSAQQIGPHWYSGKDENMLFTNCLFRSGGCSMLFTNKMELKNKAILKLKHVARTHCGADDEAYNCCHQVEDEEGFAGLQLTKCVAKSAAQSLTLNLKSIVPKIVPLSELVRFFIVLLCNVMKRMVKKPRFNLLGGGINLKTGIEHFYILPSCKELIDRLGKGLRLSEYDLEPSRMALHRWGNTSVSGIWYAFGYSEAKKRLKKGDRILMISLGSGYKCNSCVWEVMRDLSDSNVWKDCIESYPPPSLENPFKEKYNWIHDEDLGFVRYDHSRLKIY
ncbi:3-ketoacyl-CoA synthase 19-like [Vicia villosa]|uniref:3-ketoacyl-CoA synthase 19-like n=1 Tax=Vicia villosa TaxID=3911 RepID=UPI00273BA649|nr:3-ketoacyl-CoA synthase 19-like [Vicia villosa]